MKRCLLAGVGLVVALTIAGCPIAPTPGLIGEWRFVYDDGFEETWEFFENGTFEWFDEDGNFGGEGTWTRQGLSVTASESFETDEGTFDVLIQIELAANELSLTGLLAEYLEDIPQGTYSFTGTKQ